MKNLFCYHLVSPSPWPLVASFSALVVTTGAVLDFHSFVFGGVVLSLGLLMLCYTLVVWWRDILRESTFSGAHTKSVQSGLRVGMILFILSEIMFFLAFFWAYFHSSLAPTVELGSIWPPCGIALLDPWAVPLLNTLILLSSGASVTWAHHSVLWGQRKQAMLSLCLTLMLALMFTGLQAFEYFESDFTISSGVYGSTFFMATGFHGLHVIIGTLCLLVSVVRLLFFQLQRQHHFGLEASCWYWHFVDVVWLGLFISVYWWGS